MNNKPSWKDAPDWANYLAMDADGSWYWYEKKPYKRNSTTWTSYTGNCLLAHNPAYDNWKETLEQKP